MAGQGGEFPVVEDEEPCPGEPVDELGGYEPSPRARVSSPRSAGDVVVARRDAEAAGRKDEAARAGPRLRAEPLRVFTLPCRCRASVVSLPGD